MNNKTNNCNAKSMYKNTKNDLTVFCNVSFGPAGGALLLLPADSEPKADHENFCVPQTLRRKSSLAEQTIAQSRPTCLSTHSHLTELSQQPGFPCSLIHPHKRCTLWL